MIVFRINLHVFKIFCESVKFPTPTSFSTQATLAAQFIISIQHVNFVDKLIHPDAYLANVQRLGAVVSYALV